MRGPQFNLREIEIAIAAIGVLFVIFVWDPMTLVSPGDSRRCPPAPGGFMIAWVLRRGVEKFSGYSMKSPRIRLILILAAIGVAALAITILNSDALKVDPLRARGPGVFAPHSIGICDLPGSLWIPSVSSHGRNPHALRPAGFHWMDVAAWTPDPRCRACRCIGCAGLGVG